MKFLQYFKYFYLFFACLFAYDAIVKWASNREGAYLSLFFVAFAIFIFFFRNKFQQRFKDREKL
tara:strand:- start:239 stop:430 length:192 start_codon:yes stop_codon:yes gene_type:complete